MIMIILTQNRAIYIENLKAQVIQDHTNDRETLGASIKTMEQTGNENNNLAEGKIIKLFNVNDKF